MKSKKFCRFVLDESAFVENTKETAEKNLFFFSFKLESRILLVFILLSLLFWAIPNQTKAQVSTQDSLALVSLYNNTGGPSWTTQTNWLSGPVDTWYGITVTEGRVSDINLSGNNLTDTLPTDIGQIDSLVTLDLSSNQLVGPIPSELGYFFKINLINLSVNQLSDSIPPEIGNLTNLSYLYLHDNQLTGTLPSEFWNLANLQEFDLATNDISGTLPPEIGNLSNIIGFIIVNNLFYDSIPIEIGNLTNLQHLELGGNDFIGDIPEEINNLTQLQVLAMEYNQLENLPALDSLTLLTALRISDNRFTFEDIEPNLSIPSDTISYAPQAKIGTEDYITLNLGDSYTMHVIIGGSNNQYQWYKDGSPISGANDSTYTISSYSSTDAGDYHCSVTNTLATELEIQSNPIHISTGSAVNTQDSLALVSLYNNTGGPSWNNNSNWLAGAVHTWYGITVTGGRVTEINLASNNLTDTLPAAIGDLDSLKNLILEHNNLTGPLPAEIGNLKAVQGFNIWENQISGSIPPEIGNMTSLTEIYFESNSLSGSIPPELGNLDLLNLNLMNNQLTDTIPESIYNCKNLQGLILGSNQLTGEISDSIGNLTNLQVLFLNDNDFSGNIPPAFGNLSSLTELYLWGNQLTGSIPPEIGNLSNLIHIDLAGNTLDGPIPVELGNLSNLNTLILWNCQITDSIPPELGNLTNLGVLELGDNNFVGVVPESFNNLSQLDVLTLHNNSLSDLPAFDSLTLLRELYTENNEFTFEDLEPNIGIPSDTFVYSPQAKIGMPDTVYLNAGDNHNLFIDVDGANNQYQWYLNDNTISGATDSVYSISNATLGDAGDYTCLITNTIATNLTLESYPIQVHVQTSMDSTLVAYYPFNGNANDESFYEHNGGVYGAVLTNDRYNNSNSAYYFDGSGAHMNMGTDNNLVNGTDQLTFTVWINPTNLPSGQSTILSERENGDNYQFAIFDNDIYFSYWSGGNETMVWGSPGTVINNQWQFVAVTYDGTEARTYYNGQLDNVVSASGLIDSHSSDLIVGAMITSGQEPFEGDIDDIRIYNKPLTDTEINDLYILEAPDYELEVYYPFSANAKDYSGHSRDGTVIGDYNISEYFWADYTYTQGLTIPPEVFDGLLDFTISMNFSLDQYAGGTNHFLSFADSNDVNHAVSTYFTADSFFVDIPNELTPVVHGFPSPETILLGEWYHYTITRHLDTVAVYINGQLSEKWQMTNDTLEAFDNIAFLGGETDCPSGCLDNQEYSYSKFKEFKVYDRALDYTEVEAEYLQSKVFEGEVNYTEETITIDGNDNESIWSAVPEYPIENVFDGSLSDSSDFQGTWKATWDSENMYFLVTVEDDSLVDFSSDDSFETDAVDIYFDRYNDKDPGAVWENDNGYYRFYWNRAEITGENVDYSGLEYAHYDTTNGFTMEIKIPLESIRFGHPIDFTNYRALGLDVAYDDSDSEWAREAFISWSNTSNEFLFDNMSHCGTVYLYGRPPADVTMNVDMRIPILEGNLDPAVDFVDVAGTFNDWGSTIDTLYDADNDSIYTTTLYGLEAGNTIEYKFRINASWDSAYHEFPNNGPNRIHTVEDSAYTLNHYYNDDIPYDLELTNISSPSTSAELTNAEEITIDITNVGYFEISGFEVNYQVNGGNVYTDSIHDTIPSGEIYTHTFTATPDFSTPGDYEILTWLVMDKDEENTNDTLVKNIISVPVISSFPYEEDFESGHGYWSAYDIYGVETSWEHGIPDSTMGLAISYAASGMNAWVTNLSGEHLPQEKSYVQSPVFDLSSINLPYIALNRYSASDFGNGGAKVQYSLDTGKTWYPIGHYMDDTNWYNIEDYYYLRYLGNSSDQSAMGWSGYDSTWMYSIHDAMNTGGKPYVMFRVGYATHVDAGNEGFGFDDFRIYDGAPDYDVGVANIAFDNTCYPTANEQVTVELTNLGLNPVWDIDATLLANHDTCGTELITDTIYPGDTLTYTFTATANLYSTEYKKKDTLAIEVYQIDDGFAGNDNKTKGFTTYGDYTDQPGWTTYNLCNSGILEEIAWEILEDKNGDVWFTGFNGMSKFDGSTWTTYTTDDGLAANYSWAGTKAENGDLWFPAANEPKITVFDGSGFSNIDIPAVFEECAYKDHAGNLWFGSYDGNGVLKYDGSTFTVIGHDQLGIGSKVLSINQNIDSSMLFATDAGVVSFDGSVYEEIDVEGNYEMYISEIFTDSHGIVWYADNYTIYGFDGGSWQAHGDINGVDVSAINDITEDAAGNVWFGGNSAVFVRSPDGNWKTFTYEDGYLPGPGIYSTKAASDGKVWIGAYGDGVVSSDIINHNMTLNRVINPKTTGLSSNEEVIVELQNKGLNPAAGFDIAYQLNGGSIITETIADSIYPGDTYQYTFTQTVDVNTPGYYNLKTWVSVPDDNDPTNDTISFDFTSLPTISSYPYVEDFESGQGYWTSREKGNGNSWQMGTPVDTLGLSISQAASGSNCWVTNLSGEPDPWELSYVMSPIFDLTNVKLPFIGLNKKSAVNFDMGGTVAQYSLDSGQYWTTIGQFQEDTNWYNDDDFSNIGYPYHAWAGYDSAWVNSSHHIDFLAGEPAVMFRVYFVNNSDCCNEGFAFDDFEVYDGIPDYNPGILSINYENQCNLGATESIPVELTNNAINPVSNFDLTLVVNDDTLGTETYTQTIQPGDTVNYTLSNTANLYSTEYFSTSKLEVFVNSTTDGFNEDNYAIRNHPFFGDYTPEPKWTYYNTCNSNINENNIFSMVEGKDSSIWFTGFHGISRLKDNNWTVYTDSTGLADNYSWASLEDSQGILWFPACNVPKLTKFDGTDFTIIDIPAVYEECAFEDDLGNLWFGSYGGNGVLKYDGTSFTVYSHEEMGIGTKVLTISQNLNGNLLVGTDQGIVEYDGVNWAEFAINGQYGTSVSEIFKDSQGNVWFGRQSIYKYNGTTWEKTDSLSGVTTINIQDIDEDNYGNVWFSSYNYMIQYDGSQFSTITASDGLVDQNYFYSILADETGNIWIGSYRGGVARYEKAPLTAGFESFVYEDSVEFQNTTQGFVTDYNWDFGDGNTAFIENPTHIYEATGDYEVCLTVEDTVDGFTDTYCDSIQVTVPDTVTCTAEFSYTANNDTVTFTNLSGGSMTNYDWEFGDGNFSSEENPVHVFDSSGFYNVCLTITDSVSGCTDMFCDSVEVVLPVTCTAEFSYTANNDTVTFTNLSGGSITNYDWEFGDGNFSSEENPVHVFDSSGFYNVCLTITDSVSGCTDMFCDSVEIVGPAPECMAYFNFVVAHDTVSFADSSTNADVYEWSFGDGTFSSEQNPVHIYNQDSTFEVCLTIHDTINGCTDTYCTTVQSTTAPPPYCDAQFAYTSMGDTVEFENLSDGSITNYEWDFGDGNVSYEVNPVHVYDSAGSYYVCLTTEDTTNGCISEYCDSITISAPPAVCVAYFNFMIDNRTVHFIDSSQGNITDYQWEFGDGATADSANPVYTYTEPGDYQVCLQITDQAGGCSDEYCETITIQAEEVIADYSYTVFEDSVVFQNLTTGNPTDFNWDFGDGTSSHLENPYHIYQESNYYDVCLTAYDSVTGSMDDHCESIQIVLDDSVVCHSNFSYMIYGDTVEFTSLAEGSVTNYMWEFGDGASSNDENPTHYFDEGGFYDVCFTVYDSTSGCMDEYCETIEIEDSLGMNCNASFSFFTTNGKVNFTDKSEGNLTHYLWEFGDGTYADSANPVHTYEETGYYEVCLTVYDEASGCMDEYCKTVQIVIEETAICKASFSNMIDENTVNFTNTSQGDLTNTMWEFGDGSYSGDENPKHTYAQTGFYNVCLTVYDSTSGCMDEYCKVIQIVVEDTVTCYAEFKKMIRSDTAIFTNNSQGDITSYLWSFGDGNYSTAENPEHVYESSGFYSVCLTVYDSVSGCMDEYCKVIEVIVEDVATCNADFSKYVSGKKVSFSEKAKGDITSYMWDFGDGNYSNNANPDHEYAKSDFYEVCLTVYDSVSGCMDEYCRVIQIIDTTTIMCNADFKKYTENLTVSFSNKSTGEITNFMWNFGDGNYAYEKNPVHKYKKANFYEVTLTVFDSVSGCIDDKSVVAQTIDTTTVMCSSNFSKYIDSAKVVLTNKSEGNITNYFWSFGDGNYAYIANPKHTYSSPGFYEICLTVYDSVNDCMDDFCRTIQITDEAFNNCSAEFSYYAENRKISLTDKSLGDITNYSWSFGDGNYAYTANPTHTFEEPDFYEVCLSVYDENTNCMDEKCKIIQVVDTTTPMCNAEFSYYADQRKIRFTNNSLGEIDEYQWDFDDGSYSYIAETSHTYDKPGYYDVSLTVYDSSAGCIDVTNRIIAVLDTSSTDTAAICNARFNAYNRADTVSFTPKALGDYTDIFWDFGDGYNSNEENPVHIYEEAGYYDVYLTVMDSTNGCYDSRYKEVFVEGSNKSTILSAKFSQYVKENSLKVEFKDESYGKPTYWFWDFGDITPFGTDQHPTYTYSEPGYYKVCLTIGNNSGEEKTRCKYIAVGNISKDLKPYFTYFADNETATAHFNNESRGDIDGYTWEFGDGVTSEQENPSHTYADTGIYAVTLTAYNDNKGVAESYYRKVRIGNAIQNPCVFSCVWPGDANNDLEANHYDIMTIGLNFGMAGPARDSVSNRWIGHFAQDWSTFQLDGTNNKHGDCNGDGVINFEDTLAVSQNFAYSHYAQPGNKGDDWQLAFTLEDAKARTRRKGKVQLGPPVKNTDPSIYGLGYEITIFGDDSKIDYNSIEVNFGTGWFSSAADNSLIEFFKVDENKKTIYFALAKNDHKNISGEGLITEIAFTVDDGFEDGDVAFSITSKEGITASGEKTYIGGDIAIELGTDIEMCKGDSYTLTLPEGMESYTWSDGTTGTNSLEVTQSGSYSVTVTNSDGDKGADTVNVTVHELPDVDLGGDKTLKEDESVTLDPGDFSSYLWQDNSTSSTFVVLASDYGVGTHKFWVQVTDDNTCQASDTISITIQESTGIFAGKDKARVLIYPNPARDKLTIEFSNMSGKESVLSIISIDGSMIFNKKLKNKKKQFIEEIDLSEFSRGVYLIRLISDKKVSTKRLIIE